MWGWDSPESSWAPVQSPVGTTQHSDRGRTVTTHWPLKFPEMAAQMCPFYGLEFVYLVVMVTGNTATDIH